uniref:Chromosome 19 open reading frame 47 n=1 Tax=Fundulus heteroclitus TaxID=8078 RepID=A0A3Q2P0E3_FUNHE
MKSTDSSQRPLSVYLYRISDILCVYFRFSHVCVPLCLHGHFRIQKNMLMDLSKDIMMDLATSEWIQFFMDAGIPAGLAVTYAVSFMYRPEIWSLLSDERFCKALFPPKPKKDQSCRRATQSGCCNPALRLGTGAVVSATRMIANALSHDSPPATPARRPIDNRLSVTVSNSQANKNKAGGRHPADEGKPAAKRRRVTAEMEGKYIISMPKGTTPRTRRILAQQAKKGLKRTSVFERLGAESMADTTTSNSKPTGVFSRLDGGDASKAISKQGNTEANVDEDDEESDGEGSVLQYAGVLKSLPPLKKKATKKPPATLRRLGGKFKLPPSDTPTSSSTSAPNGLPTPKISVLQRLGKPPATSPAVTAASADTQDNRVTSTRSRCRLPAPPIPHPLCTARCSDPPRRNTPSTMAPSICLH